MRRSGYRCLKPFKIIEKEIRDMVRTILALAVLCLAFNGASFSLGIHEGKVVSAGDGKLVIVDEVDGDNETFNVVADSKIMLDGKPAELEDLAAGHSVKVTSKQRKGLTVAVVIDARSSE